MEAKNTTSIPDAVKMFKLRGTDGIIEAIIVMILYSMEHFLHSGRSQLQAYNCTFSVTNIAIVIGTLCAEYQASICSLCSMEGSAS